MAVGTNAKNYGGRTFQAIIFNAANDQAFASSKTDRKKNCNKKMDLLDKELLLFFTCAQKNQLRYMIIGGYAVNYYGFNRNTGDLDIWLAPTNENKLAFIQTLLCLNFSEAEVAALYEKDFTQGFVTSISGNGPSIDFLTVVHFSLSYNEAESKKEIYEIMPALFINVIPYDFLINMKLKSGRDKDLWDVARLNELKLKNKKK